MYLPDDALSEIAVLGRKAHPKETCGILLPTPWRGRWIVEVKNTSDHPKTSFCFTTEALRDALSEWFETVSRHDPHELVIWHTHPGGGVGPSRTDMQARVEGVGHLVVALTDRGPVPSFY